MDTSLDTSPVDAAEAESVHLTLWVDRRLADELRRVAKLNDRTVSAEVRQALRDYLRDAPR